jgi:hypothetical protein
MSLLEWVSRLVPRLVPVTGLRIELFLQRLEAVDTATVSPFLLMAIDALEKTNPKELE